MLAFSGVQEEDGSMENTVTALYDLAELCNFNKGFHEMITDLHHFWHKKQEGLYLRSHLMPEKTITGLDRLRTTRSSRKKGRGPANPPVTLTLLLPHASS